MIKLFKVVKMNDEFKLGEINLEIKTKAITTILGASGSGKTTMIKLIAGFNKPDQGEITMDDQPIKKEEVVYINQGGTLFKHLSVRENLNLVKEISDEKIIECFQTLNLDATYLDKYVHQLSGGEQQRVDLSRALLNDAKLIILDEAFSALDSKNKENISNILVKLVNELNKTVVLITHDILDALYLSDDIICLEDGEVKLTLTPEELKRDDVDIPRSIITERQLQVIKKGIDG